LKHLDNQKLGIFTAILQSFLILIFVNFVFGQSTEQQFPSPIKENILTGKIAARDIGDSRLTTYFYTFNATQGDIVVTTNATNFNGDIDIYESETLRPLTKIRLFADFSADEISRTIYLRKSEKLLLRIEGRSPNDDDALFKIKFEGSFVPSNETENTEASLPKVKEKIDTDIEVNSVGTIISVRPKPTPRVEIAKVEEAEKTSKPKTAKVKKPKIEIPKVEIPKISVPKIKKPRIVVAKPKVEKPPKVKKSETAKVEKDETLAIAKPEKFLVVIFLDGTRFEKSMKDVLKFSVEKETLTIISKNGEIKRYSIYDVAKLSIE
jgi:hypothetical protein